MTFVKCYRCNRVVAIRLRRRTIYLKGSRHPWALSSGIVCLRCLVEDAISNREETNR
jgi:hypothetical protein